MKSAAAVQKECKGLLCSKMSQGCGWLLCRQPPVQIGRLTTSIPLEWNHQKERLSCVDLSNCVVSVHACQGLAMAPVPPLPRGKRCPQGSEANEQELRYLPERMLQYTSIFTTKPPSPCVTTSHSAPYAFHTQRVLGTLVYLDVCTMSTKPMADSMKPENVVSRIVLAKSVEF